VKTAWQAPRGMVPAWQSYSKRDSAEGLVRTGVKYRAPEVTDRRAMEVPAKQFAGFERA